MGLFVTEIDNSVQVDKVTTLLVTPIWDKDKKLWGVLQLVNSCRYITDELIQSVCAVIPSLGEVLRAAEETRKTLSNHSGVNNKLKTMMEQTDNQETLNDAHIEEIFQTLDKIDDNLDAMLKEKVRILKKWLLWKWKLEIIGF